MEYSFGPSSLESLLRTDLEKLDCPTSVAGSRGAVAMGVGRPLGGAAKEATGLIDVSAGVSPSLAAPGISRVGSSELLFLSGSGSAAVLMEERLSCSSISTGFYARQQVS